MFLNPIQPQAITMSFQLPTQEDAMGSWKKRVEETLRKGVLDPPPPDLARFPPLGCHCFLLSCASSLQNLRLSRPEALLEWSRSFWGRCVPWYVFLPHMFCTPCHGPIVALHERWASIAGKETGIDRNPLNRFPLHSLGEGEKGT